MAIHPTAVIDPTAEINRDAEVGAYSVIGPEVRIGAGCRIGPHVVIERNTTVGGNSRIFKGASVGSDPQDLKYAGEPTTLTIGENTTIREFVTINRGTTESNTTTVGSGCLLMAYAHVAHDCVVGDSVILANAVQLGGHVHIEDHVIVGGSVPVHQFTHIGCHCIIGGGYRAVQDVPPYIRTAGEPLRYIGINAIGLKRRGFPEDTMAAIKKAYRYIYRSGLKRKEALEKIRNELPSCDELAHLAAFIEKSERGII